MPCTELLSTQVRAAHAWAKAGGLCRGGCAAVFGGAQGPDSPRPPRPASDEPSRPGHCSPAGSRNRRRQHMLLGRTSRLAHREGPRTTRVSLTQPGAVTGIILQAAQARSCQASFLAVTSPGPLLSPGDPDGRRRTHSASRGRKSLVLPAFRRQSTCRAGRFRLPVAQDALRACRVRLRFDAPGRQALRAVPDDQAVCSVSPYLFRISLIGWCQVSPPLLQLPQPPEVTPCAWSPLMNEPPESPGSAHTLVLVI